jgi:hypothetical protein
MQDKDFDALFKRKFEHLEGRPLHSKSWNDLSSQLDAADDLRRRKVHLRYTLLMAALLLGHLAWIIYWLGPSTFFTNAQINKNPVYIQDTIVRTIKIVQYDTIYRTVIQEAFRYESFAPEKLTQTAKTGLALNSKTIAKSSLDSNSLFLPINQVEIQVNNPNEHTAVEPVAPKTSLFASSASLSTDTAIEKSIQLQAFPPTDSLTDIYGLPVEKAHTTLADTNLDSFILEQNSANIQQQMADTEIPAAFKASINQYEQPAKRKPAYPLHYMWITGGNLLLFPGKLEGYIISSGLQIEKNLSNRLAIGGSLRLGAAYAESTDIDRRFTIGSNPPENIPAEFEFAYWDVDFMPILNYNLYTHYQIASIGKTRIMAGAGSQWTSTLPHTLDYNYLNPDNLDEIDRETEEKMETRFLGIHVLMQTERPLSKRMALGLRASGLIPAQPPQTVLHNQLGLDFWLKFRI